MGYYVENVSSLAPHAPLSGSVDGWCYHRGKGQAGFHEASPVITRAQALEVLAEAATSESAWLDAMPSTLKSYVQGLPSAQRTTMRTADQEMAAALGL
jgi:hypothetical protein